MNLHKLSLLFCIGILSASLCRCAGAQSGTHIAAVWANDGGDKVTQDERRASANPAAVHNSVWDGAAVHLFGAKNEVVGGCLILEAPTTPAANVSVSFNKLVGPGGSVIGSTPASGNGVFDWTHRQIELFYVRYLQIKGLSLLGYETYDERHVPRRLRRPWTGDGYATAGTGWTDRPDHDKFYPEIAVPLELVPTFSIAAGQNQSLWIDVYIPKTAAPGLYQGTLTISEGGVSTHQVPINLTVRNFTLPDVPSAKTMAFMSADNVNMRYFGADYINPRDPSAESSILVRQRHYQLAHRHKISLIDENYDYTDDQPSPYEWLSRLDGSLFTAANGYAGPGVNTGNNIFVIGPYGGWSWRNGTEADMRLHTNAWVNWFDQNSPSTEYVLYLIDESSNYPQIETWAEWIHNNPGPGHRMKSLATMFLPDAAAHTPSLDVPTSTYGLGQPEIWQPLVDQYTHDPVKRFWMYNGLRPLSGCFMTDDDGVALRELAWAQYKKGIQRWFYWETTYYNNFQGGTGQTNVFESARTFGGQASFDNILGYTGWNDSNGDGVLFYPGTDQVYPQDSYGVLGPFASLRLKHWRRGIQDCDYLTLAAKIDPVKVQQIVNTLVPKAFWEYGVSDPNDPTWVRTDISWPTDPDRWEAVRSQLADIIEQGATRVNTLLQAGNMSGIAGKSVLLRALLRRYPDALGVAGKTVAFKIDGTNVGTSTTAANGFTSLSYTIPASLGPGSHTITAVFDGDAGYAASQGTGTLSAYYNTLLQAGSASGKAGKTTLLRALLRRYPDAAGVGSETITFQIDGTTVGTATTASNGFTSMNYTLPAGTTVGNHTITVSFVAKDGYLASHGGATLTVNP